MSPMLSAPRLAFIFNSFGSISLAIHNGLVHGMNWEWRHARNGSHMFIVNRTMYVNGVAFCLHRTHTLRSEPKSNQYKTIRFTIVSIVRLSSWHVQQNRNPRKKKRRREKAFLRWIEQWDGRHKRPEWLEPTTKIDTTMCVQLAHRIRFGGFLCSAEQTNCCANAGWKSVSELVRPVFN